MEDAVRKKYAKEQLKLFRMDQAAKLASIGMNTAEGIVKAVAAFPTSVPPGAPWTYMIGAMGAAQAGMVLSQKPPKYARGGMIGGNLHAQGGTVIEAERGAVEDELYERAQLMLMERGRLIRRKKYLKTKINNK